MLNILKDYDNVIFDLDGTLIDSKESVLASLKYAFEHSGVFTVDYSKFVLGPPLKESVTQLIPSGQELDVDMVISHFKDYYDSTGYKEAILFEGVETLLSHLKKDNKEIMLVTNKRCIPTERILNMFPVFEVFQCVYSLDSFDPAKQSKSEVLASMIVKENIAVEASVYVGDTNADRLAAHSNLIDFVLMDHCSEVQYFPV